jgi:hypothetical protein
MRPRAPPRQRTETKNWKRPRESGQVEKKENGRGKEERRPVTARYVIAFGRKVRNLGAVMAHVIYLAARTSAREA